METRMKLFDRSVLATDQVYIVLRDDGDFINARNYVEELWRYFEPYADPHFRKEIAVNFQPRYWEMYLGCLALRAKLSVMPKKKNKGKGPDLRITLTTGQNLFIEATAPGPGTGDNEVSEPPPLRLGINEIAPDIPVEKILLRITSGLEKKFKAYDRYLRDPIPILRPNDPYIIAVNLGAMASARSEFFDPPLIIRSLFGVGNLMVLFDQTNPGLRETHYSICHQIIKHNDKPIRTDYFLDSRYRGLSAIVFSDAHPFRKPDGSEFKLVHNPNATNPIDRGLFKIGREYWAEGTRIHSTNWNEHSSCC